MEPGTKSPPLASQFTAKTYPIEAKRFIEDGLSLMVSRAPGSNTRQQWGAWLAYFLRKRIPATLMGRKDEYMVPAEWPHMFDAEATIAQDHLAGEAFVRLTKPGRRSVILVPDSKRGFTSRTLPPEIPIAAPARVREE